MSVAVIGGIIGTALGLADQVLKKMPNYDQKKREKFYELKDLYGRELVKAYPDRDDDRIMNLRDEIKDFLAAFNREINS